MLLIMVILVLGAWWSIWRLFEEPDTTEHHYHAEGIITAETATTTNRKQGPARTFDTEPARGLIFKPLVVSSDRHKGSMKKHYGQYEG